MQTRQEVMSAINQLTEYLNTHQVLPDRPQQEIKLARPHFARRLIELLDEKNAAIDAKHELDWNYDRKILILMREIFLHTRDQWALESDEQRKGSLHNVVHLTLLLSREFTRLYNAHYAVQSELAEEINLWRNIGFLVQCQITPQDYGVRQTIPISAGEIHAIFHDCFELIDTVLSGEIRFGLTLIQNRERGFAINQFQEDIIREPYRNPHALPYLHAFVSHKREHIRLEKMLAAITFALTLDMNNSAHRLALLRQLQMIGESMTGKNFSDQTARLAQDINWQLWIRLRNKLSHNEWDIHRNSLATHLTIPSLQNIQQDLRGLQASLQQLQIQHQALGQSSERRVRHYSAHWYLRLAAHNLFLNFITDIHTASLIDQVEYLRLNNLLTENIRDREPTLPMEIRQTIAHLFECNFYLIDANNPIPAQGVGYFYNQNIQPDHKEDNTIKLQYRASPNDPLEEVKVDDVGKLRTAVAELSRTSNQNNGVLKLSFDQAKKVITANGGHTHKNSPQYINTCHFLSRFPKLTNAYSKEQLYHNNLENPDRNAQRRNEARLAAQHVHVRAFAQALNYDEDSYNQDRQQQPQSFDPLRIIQLIKQEMQALQAMLTALPDSDALRLNFPEDTTTIYPTDAKQEGVINNILTQITNRGDLEQQAAVKSIRNYTQLKGTPLYLERIGLHGLGRGERQRISINEALRDMTVQEVINFGKKCAFYRSLVNNPAVIEACFYYMARIQKYMVVLDRSNEVSANQLPFFQEFKALRNFVHHGIDLFDTMNIPAHEFMTRYTTLFIHRLLPALEQVATHIQNQRAIERRRQVNLDALLIHGLHGAAPVRREASIAPPVDRVRRLSH